MIKTSDMVRNKRGIVAAGILAALLVPGAAVAQPDRPKIEFVDPMVGSALAKGGHDLSPLGMFVSADGVVKVVILLLLLASFITWTIGIAKWIEIRNERRRLAAGLSKLVRAADLEGVGDTGYAPIGEMVMNAEDEIAVARRADEHVSGDGIKDRIAMRLERLEAALRRRIGRGVVLLAIIGSSAPFIGLFGTVWGIMNSFIGIAESHTTNLAVVAPGIAEALLTTAAGLVAAIPAGIIYNLFARVVAAYGGELGDASAAVMCLAGREIDRAGARG